MAKTSQNSTSKKGGAQGQQAEGDAGAKKDETGAAEQTQTGGNEDAPSEQPANQPEKSGNGGKVAVLHVSAKADRFYRAGLRFSRETMTLRADELSDEQIEQIRNEPMLVVVDEQINE